MSLSTMGLRRDRLHLLRLAMGLVLGGGQDSELPPLGSGQGPMTPPAQLCRGEARVHVSWGRPQAAHRLPPALSPDAARHPHGKKAQAPWRSRQSALSPTHQPAREQRRGRQEWGTAIPNRGEGDDVTVKTPVRRV